MKYTLYFLCLFTVLACGTSSQSTNNTASFANCKYGSPKPIFSDKTPLVSSHAFELTDHIAKEIVFFDADIKLELLQSGCEKPKQEFQFTIPGNSKNYSSEEWIDMALNQFNFLGNLEESLQPLLFWANALKAQKENIKLGKPVHLEQGHYVKIDKLAGDKQGLLMIELYQE